MNAELVHRIERLEAAISELTIHLIKHHQINCVKNLLHDRQQPTCR